MVVIRVDHVFDDGGKILTVREFDGTTRRLDGLRFIAKLGLDVAKKSEGEGKLRVGGDHSGQKLVGLQILADACEGERLVVVAKSCEGVGRDLK